MQEVRSVQEIRKQLDDILNRARNDEAFGKRLNSDPEATLREAGFYSRGIGEVSEEIKQFVHGKRTKAEYEQIHPNLRCDYLTCWISWCDDWGTFYTKNPS